MSSSTENHVETNAIVGVILAGGRSSRMGGCDKAMLELGDQHLLERAICRLSKTLDCILVSHNEGLPGFNSHPVLKDSIEGHYGPLSGILTAMLWAEKNAPHISHILSVAVDTPFFPIDLVERMMKGLALSGSAPRLAKFGGDIHPTFGLWPVALADDLDHFLRSGERKVRLFAQAHTCDYVEFPSLDCNGEKFDPFFNINRREDLIRAQELVNSLG